MSLKQQLSRKRDHSTSVLDTPTVLNGATKAAVRSLDETWTVELKDRGIRINTLSPGATDTPIIDGQFATKEQADQAKEAFSSDTPLGRLGSRRTWPVTLCLWPRTAAATSPVSTCRSTAVSRRSRPV